MSRLKSPLKTAKAIKKLAASVCFSQVLPLPRTEIDMRFLRPYWLEKPDILTLTDWFRNTFHHDAALRDVMHRMKRARLQAVDDAAKSHRLCEAVAENRQQLHDLVLSLWYLDPVTCEWSEAVQAGLAPINASLLLTRRGPSEHVVCDNAILRWAAFAPECIRDFHATLKAACYQAPNGAHQYSRLEWGVRRAQRAVWPWATSLECEGMILREMWGTACEPSIA